MKKIFLFSLFALLGMTQMTAQEYEYIPLVREGVKWVYFYVNTDDYHENQFDPNLAHGTVYLNLEFKGDTVINGKTYKAMHKYYGDAINELNDTIPIYMREEDRVVYAIVPDGIFYYDCPIGNYGWSSEDFAALHEGQEFVLYDFRDPIAYWYDLFNQNSWFCYDCWFCYDDMIVAGQHLVKRYVGDFFNEFYVIESIGLDAYSNNYTLCFFKPTLGSDVMFSLSHVIEDGEIIYKGIYYSPDTLVGIDEVVADQRGPQDGNYYDLVGRAVGKDLPTVPGIYIHNGKKIVVR